MSQDPPRTRERTDVAASRLPSPLRILGVVANHAVPLLSAVVPGGSPIRFSVLTVFNVVLGIIGIIGANLVVTLLQTPPRPDAKGWSRIEPWVSLCLVLGFLAVFFFVLFGAVTFGMIPGGFKILGDRGVSIGAGAMLLTALPGLLATAVADRHGGVTEAARMARDKPKVLLQVASGFALAFLSIYAFQWFGGYGLYPLMIAMTAFFIFRDLRPDLILRNVF